MNKLQAFKSYRAALREVSETLKSPCALHQPELYAGERQGRKDMIRHAKTMATNPLVVRMAEIADPLIQRYHADFWWHDLNIIEDGGMFAWYVHDCGTHIARLDCVDERDAAVNMSVLQSLKRSYVSAKCYHINTETGQINEMRRDYQFTVFVKGEQSA